jgi:hypothetical protein
LGKADYAQRHSWPGVARRLTRKVVLPAVHDQRAADDEMQFESFRPLLNQGNALCVGGNIAQVAGVVLSIVGPAVAMAIWIKMTTRGFALRVSQVAEFMDMKSVFAWLKPNHLASDDDVVTALLER